MDIGNIIAHNLKKLREQRNLSQGQLAELAGVSKVVVSQIEKGDSNPTINTIWKITGALGLSYTSLLEPETSPVYIKKADIPELVEDKYHLFTYYPKNSDRNFEMYLIELESGCSHTAVGHSANSYEYIMLTEGRITLTVNEQEYTLEKDDALCFNASGAHTYKNNAAYKAKAVLIIQYL